VKRIILITMFTVSFLWGSLEGFGFDDIKSEINSLRQELNEIKSETEDSLAMEQLVGHKLELAQAAESKTSTKIMSDQELAETAGTTAGKVSPDNETWQDISSTATTSSTENSQVDGSQSSTPSTEPYANSRDRDWDADIRKQTLDSVSQYFKIDKDLKEAREIKLPTTKSKTSKPVEITPPVASLEEIVASMIKPELRATKIDLKFDQANLGDILMTLGESAKINIVLDPALRNNVLDLHLKDVTLSEALLLISNSYNLGFKRVGDSLFISSKDKLRNENLMTRVFKLRNISVEEAKVLINDVVDTINASPEINTLMVVGDPEQIAHVEKILKQVDVPQPQVVLEAKIIEIGKDALRDLGVDWSDSVTLSYQESGRPVDFANVEDAPANAFKIFSFSRNPIQLNAVIQMLENQNKAKVLSNPRIATLNDKKAEIFVGDRIPYTVTSISGGVATSDVLFEEPGIRLNITPSIIEDDFVVIKIEPEVSFIYSWRGPDDAYPQTKKRQATAYVRIKNNEPFMIGGLLNQEDKRNLYKVPFLGSIPLLGNLFSYESHTVADTELIITVVPTIVHGEL
jgi:type II secretory pathway component GspD/PulD (secretin)